MRIGKIIVAGTLFLFSQLVTGQNASKFDRDFDSVADAFEENLKPYLEKFVKAQFNNPPQTESQRLLEISSMDVYVQKAAHLRTDFKKVMLKDKDMNDERISNRKRIIDSFERLYKYEFPGLDYLYFEKVKSQLKN